LSTKYVFRDEEPSFPATNARNSVIVWIYGNAFIAFLGFIVTSDESAPQNFVIVKKCFFENIPGKNY